MVATGCNKTNFYKDFKSLRKFFNNKKYLYKSLQMA